MHSREQRRYLWAVIFIFLIFLYSPLAQAVPGGANPNWSALPPYNTLWPLWSPALSPVDSITGLPTPVVSNLAPTTVLPVQPGLTWDPLMLYPWLLYNTPLGMAYYDPFFGINLWPPKYLTLGPLALPPNYANLPPTSSTWISSYVPIANSLYLASLPKFSLPPVMLTPVVPAATPFVPAPPPIPPAVTPGVTPFAPVPPVPPVPPLAPVVTPVVAPPLTPATATPIITIPLLSPSAII